MTEPFRLTNDYHVDRSIHYINNNFTDDYVYFFVGDFSTHDDTTLFPANNTVDTLYYDVFNKMIMGKLIGVDNLCLGVRNIPYETIVFTPYDDTVDLTDENYYCIVNADSYSHIYKCLYNNGGVNSSAQPNFAHINGANTTLYQTSDGYQWKYLYSVDSATISKFATNDYFPLVANNTTTTLAVPGSINVIEVITGGKLYDNYVSGTFLANDIRIEPKLYQISNSSIKTTRSFYSGCLIYLSSGDGVGQYEVIEDYFSNSSGNYILLENEFTTSPTNGTTFEITPQCKVYNSGSSEDVCIARAIVNAVSSNSIAYIEILYPGTNQFIVSANVIANSAVGIVASNRAVVRPIQSPPGGHGANVALELNASHVLMSVTLANSEQNTILTSNKFQQIGFIKNPKFANVELNLTGATGLFNRTETAYMVDLELVDTNIAITTSGNTIVGNATTAEFESQFTVGDSICISNGSVYQIANVGSITDNNHMTIVTNGFFDLNTANVYHSNITETIEVVSVTSQDKINASNIAGLLTQNSVIVGGGSGSLATISSIVRNGDEKDFNTFVQLHKYTITLLYGTFTPGETVNQGDRTALLHSVVNNTMYLGDLSAVFTSYGTHVIGSNSGAEAIITNVYEPELAIGKGSIQYVDNINPVTRQPTETEQFKLVLAF